MRLPFKRDYFKPDQGLPSDSQIFIAGILRATDLMLVVISAYLAYWLSYSRLDLNFYYLETIFIATLLSMNFLHVAGIYRRPLNISTRVQIIRIIFAWALVLLTLLAVAWFLGILDWFNRRWVVSWFILALCGFIIARFITRYRRRQLQRLGALTLQIALVGADDYGAGVVRQLRQSPQASRVIGIFDDRKFMPEMIEGVPVRGNIDDLVALTRTTRIDEIVLAIINRPAAEIQAIIDKLVDVPINIKLCARTLELDVPVRGYSAFAGLPLLHIQERPLSGWDGWVKSVEDRILGLGLLLCALPIMGLIALAIKLDSKGPVFFRQNRYGFKNNNISVYKFRTMYDAADAPGIVPQATKSDPRVTRVGRFLRKTSLDELPQLLNVVGGSMSLVGPRPHAVEHNQHYAQIIDGYLGRHRVKPGITGWAQVNGLRGETNTDELMRLRVQYDLYYIDHWSFYMDMKILAMTLIYGFVHKNAY